MKLQLFLVILLALTMAQDEEFTMTSCFYWDDGEQDTDPTLADYFWFSEGTDLAENYITLEAGEFCYIYVNVDLDGAVSYVDLWDVDEAGAAGWAGEMSCQDTYWTTYADFEMETCYTWTTGDTCDYGDEGSETFAYYMTCNHADNCNSVTGHQCCHETYAACQDKEKCNSETMACDSANSLTAVFMMLALALTAMLA